MDYILLGDIPALLSDEKMLSLYSAENDHTKILFNTMSSEKDNIYIGDTFILIHTLEELFLCCIEFAYLEIEKPDMYLQVESRKIVPINLYLPFWRLKITKSNVKSIINIHTSLNDQIIVCCQDDIYITNRGGPKIENMFFRFFKYKNVWLINEITYFVNKKGQFCCLREGLSEDFVFYEGNIIENCVKIVGGYEHVCVLTREGKVYTHGVSTKGQVGQGFINSSHGITHMLECFGIVKIKDIVSGGWHTLAISETNDLYAWGWNQSFQVDRNSNSIVAEPVLIELKYDEKTDQVDVREAKAGLRHSIALDNDGNIWGWGLNKFNQILISTHKKTFPSIIFRKNNKFKVIDITCGRWCTLIRISKL